MQLNPSKPIAGIVVMAAFLYGVTILLTSDPVERINRTCAPVFQWPQRLFVAGAQIFDKGAVPGIEAKFSHGNQICREFVWNTFYEQEFEKLQKQMHQAAQPVTQAAQAAAQAAGGAQ